MGTKRQLADFVRGVVELSPPGPLLDVFAGMCAVGTAVAPFRQIWTNDLQHFAHAVSLAHFCSKSQPLSRIDAVAATMKTYSSHMSDHCAIAASRLTAEDNALSDENSNALAHIYDQWLAEPALQLPEGSERRSSSLFRDTFAGSYFGLSQAIEIDAIRESIDDALASTAIDCDQHRWLILALGVAISKTSTSTGHFAQPLTPKPHNIKRFAKQRRASVRSEWLKAIQGLAPIGTRHWRSNNKAFRDDAVKTLSTLDSTSVPAVVYADPPYTNDQYSRYYHLYDTLVLYDYPDAQGKGRYRSDRAISSFSLATQVEKSLEELIGKCASLGSDLILSYPLDGLLKNSREVIPELAQRYFGRQPAVYEIAHKHSTMGGSKGAGKRDVTEVIYRAFH